MAVNPFGPSYDSALRNDRPLFKKTRSDFFVYTLIDVTCKQRFLSPQSDGTKSPDTGALPFLSLSSVSDTSRPAVH